MRVLVALLALALPAFSQSGLLAGSWNNQFFSNTGQPLSGGKVYTCSAGSTCPGTPLATFTDASLFSQNSQPILLGTNGRPMVGSQVVGIWLTPGLSYKFVVQTSAGVTLYTVDNITGVSGSSSATTYWTLAGSTISNNNGSGTGTVSMGGSATVATNLSIGQTLKLQSTGAQFAILRAANVMASDVTWRMPAADGVGCLSSDGLGNLSIVTCGGGGGGGSPGGVNSNVQYNSSSTFGGSGNFTWNNGSQLLTVTATGVGAAGIATTGFFQSVGGLVVTNACTAYNCVQSASAAGGMAGRSFTATKYVQVGNNSGTPTESGSDTFNAGALYWDTMSNDLQVYDGSGWLSLGAGSGSPGGSTSAVQYNSSGAFAGSANFSWNNTLRVLTVNASSPASAGLIMLTGYIESATGFSTLHTADNAIQAPSGGVLAKWLKTTDSVFWTEEAAPALSALGQSRIYMDSASHLLRVSQNNGAYANLVGSGGGSPGGSNLSLQFNNGGAFAGTYNGTTGVYWDDTNKRALFTTAGATAAIGVANGFVQADKGFVATSSCAEYNCVQAPSGGLAGKSFTGTAYMKAISASDPVATGTDSLTGAVYWNSTSSVLKVFNGSTWLTLGTGGVNSLNALTGTLSIACAAASSCSVGAAGATVTITAPQPLATSSQPTFNGVISTGAFNSSSGGTTFQNSNTNFQVNSAGDISIVGDINMNGGSGANLAILNTESSSATPSLLTRGGVNLCSAGTCDSGNAMRINGTVVATSTGYWTGLLNTPLTGPSVVYIGPTGSFYGRAVSGASTGIFCTSVADGWQATTTDDYLVICRNGLRYRTLLVNY